MPQGNCKWFSNQKGYGFITPVDGSADLFVHQSSILVDGFRSLSEGQLVKYEIDNSNKNGPRAKEVEPIGVVNRSSVLTRGESGNGQRPHS